MINRQYEIIFLIFIIIFLCENTLCNKLYDCLRNIAGGLLEGSGSGSSSRSSKLSKNGNYYDENLYNKDKLLQSKKIE